MATVPRQREVLVDGWPALAPGPCSRRIRRPGGRGPPKLRPRRDEESPGSTATRRRVTPAGRKPRDSATESKPPCSA